VSVSFHHTRASGSLVSVSLGGAEITTGLQPPAGALVQIEIGVPGAEPIAVDGALVRSVRPGIIGVQFVWARMDSKERLRDIVLRGLSGEDAEEAMVLVKGPGLRSALRLADFWSLALVAGAGLARLSVG
jgi:PilZ domain